MDLQLLPSLPRAQAPSSATAVSAARALLTHPQWCVKPVALAQHLDAQAASSAQHGPAAVDDLALSEALEALGVLAQTQGVKAVVAVVVGCRRTGGEQETDASVGRSAASPPENGQR